MKSVTFGDKVGCFEFGCAVHTDSNDKFSSEEEADVKDALHQAKTTQLTEEEVHAQYMQDNIFKKLESFFDQFGAGKPTTILYNKIASCPHLLHSQSGTRRNQVGALQQLFLHDGVGAVYPIEHGANAVFYAYTHRHGSSLCLKVFDNGDVSSCNIMDRHMLAFSYSC